MNLPGKLSIAAMVTGVVVFVVLLTVGLVVKKTVHDTITSRLEYDLPDGADDPSFMQCYHSTTGNFANEYYLWNLTNLDQVLVGGKPEYNLTGPYTYSQWYCNYNFTKDTSTGFLRYKQLLQGYRFIPDQSATDDSVSITNVNPAYMGLIQAAGSEASLLAAMSGVAVQTIIEGLQADSTKQAVGLQSMASVLPMVNAQILYLMGESAVATSVMGPTIAANAQMGATAAMFFGPDFPLAVPGQGSIKCWYNYTMDNYPGFTEFSFSSTSQDAIFTAWQNGTKLALFATESNTTLVSLYSISENQAYALLNYLNNYLLLPSTYPSLGVPAQVQSAFYSQWANGTLNRTLESGWEIGYPDASGILAADVALLFDVTSDCSLVTNAGVAQWIAQLTATTPQIPTCSSGAYTLTPTEFGAVLQWLVLFAQNVVSELIVEEKGLDNWDDLIYAQWGSLVLDVTLGNNSEIPFAPEIAVFNPKSMAQYNPTLNSIPDAAVATCVKYTLDEVKDLLVGPYGLFNSTNMQDFLLWMNAGDTASVTARYPPLAGFANFWKPYCLVAYFAYFIAFSAVKPNIQAQFIDTQKGMFVTRTANEWLFTAQDDFLQYVGQDNDTSLVGNTTLTQEQADARNFTYYRIYTGDNDLHWSLMPYNEGVELPFWNGTVNITGYNGTQFLPYNVIEDQNPGGYPLVLFHHLINRSVPFEYVGKDKWDGVNVAYITMTDDAVASAEENPDNYQYYSVYTGLINKTSNPPYLPVYLSRADQIGCEDAVTETQKLTDDIFPGYDPTDKMSRHRLALFLLIEPLLGSTVWGNLPIQMNLKITQEDTSIFYPNVTSHFAPIYWNAIGDIATKDDLDEIKNVLYVGIIAWKAMVGVGVGFGVICFVGGVIGFHHHRKHENELKDSSENSMANLKTSSSSVSAFSN